MGETQDKIYPEAHSSPAMKVVSLQNTVVGQA